jgi:O-antigen/teichoic acid export membrane protein
VTRNVWHTLLLKIAAAVLLIVGLAIAQSSRVVLSATLVVGIVGIIVDSFANTGFSALRALRRNEWVAALQAVGPLLLWLVLLALEQAPASVLLVMVVQAAISALVAFLTLRKVWQIAGAPRRERHVIRRMIKGAWLFVVSEILSTVYLQSAVAVLGNSGATTDAGTLRAAQTAVAYTLIAPTLLFVTALPLLNDAKLERRGYRLLVGMMAAGALCYGLAAGAATYLLAPRVVVGLYGNEFAAAIPLLQQFWYIPLVRSGSLIGAAVLLSHGRARLRVQLQALVMVVNVALALLLIPTGGLGAAFVVITTTELLVLTLYALATGIVGRRLRL